MNKAKAVYFLIAGLTLIAIGGYISFIPVNYLGQFILNQEVNLKVLSEMRGMGGSLFVFGLFIFSACFEPRLAKSALTISILIFTSFSVFRTIGIVVDGVPNQAILIALSIEVLLAILGIIIWLKHKPIRNLGEKHEQS